MIYKLFSDDLFTLSCGISYTAVEKKILTKYKEMR
jgi:hypothetical protein